MDSESDCARRNREKSTNKRRRHQRHITDERNCDRRNRDSYTPELRREKTRTNVSKEKSSEGGQNREENVDFYVEPRSPARHRRRSSSRHQRRSSSRHRRHSSSKHRLRSRSRHRRRKHRSSSTSSEDKRVSRSNFKDNSTQLLLTELFRSISNNRPDYSISI